MRCACPNCDEYMVHSDTNASCVCPGCLSRCHACLGTGQMLSREAVAALRGTAAAKEGQEDAGELPQTPPGK